MYNAPQIAPVTTMARNHKLLLEKLKDGPVFLTQRGTETAVILSAAEWRSIVKRLEVLEQERRQQRLARSNQTYAAWQADPSQAISEEEYQQRVAEAGLAE